MFPLRNVKSPGRWTGQKSIRPPPITASSTPKTRSRRPVSCMVSTVRHTTNSTGMALSMPRHATNSVEVALSRQSCRLKQAGLLRSGVGWGDAQVPVGKLRRHATARRPGEKPDLDEVGLVDVLDSLRLLGQRGGDRVQSDRAALELQDQGLQQLAIHRLEADLVNFQHGKRLPCDLDGSPTVAAHLSEVADPAQQSIGDPRSGTRAARDLRDSVRRDLDLQDPRRPRHDLLELRLGVEVQPVDRSEPVAKRAAEQALTRGCANTCEMRERQRRGARPDSL